MKLLPVIQDGRVRFCFPGEIIQEKPLGAIFLSLLTEIISLLRHSSVKAFKWLSGLKDSLRVSVSTFNASRNLLATDTDKALACQPLIPNTNTGESLKPLSSSDTGQEVQREHAHAAALPESRCKFKPLKIGHLAQKQCVKCGRGFTPNSNRQKYCPQCKEIVEKERNRLYVKRHRQKIKEQRSYKVGAVASTSLNIKLPMPPELKVNLPNSKGTL
ncbi:hypothetical protein [Thermanaeromonas sp. C210]|uniref:hypothetical protein n=1 Tax=Thermanaeromonas sp. C210 TaxID=2731925 RepID=UPI00155C49DB|nr:hypothetical protein [Thermanaeromonas sp. C210]GFN24285.1 hypothetical protein TAMC210_26030 [Thermanaeromonas sp. C210]